MSQYIYTYLLTLTLSPSSLTYPNPQSSSFPATLLWQAARLASPTDLLVLAPPQSKESPGLTRVSSWPPSFPIWAARLYSARQAPQVSFGNNCCRVEKEISPRPVPVQVLLFRRVVQTQTLILVLPLLFLRRPDLDTPPPSPYHLRFTRGGRCETPLSLPGGPIGPGWTLPRAYQIYWEEGVVSGELERGVRRGFGW